MAYFHDNYSKTSYLRAPDTDIQIVIDYLHLGASLTSQTNDAELSLFPAKLDSLSSGSELRKWTLSH